jgi:ribosomal protein L14
MRVAIHQARQQRDWPKIDRAIVCRTTQLADRADSTIDHFDETAFNRWSINGENPTRRQSHVP